MTGYVWSATGARTSVRSSLVRRGGLWLPKLKYTNLAAGQNSRSGSTLKTHRLCRPAIQTDPDLTIQTCDQDLCPVVFKNILFPRLWLPKGLHGIKFVFEFTDYAFFFLKASGCSLFDALVLPSRWRQLLQMTFTGLFRMKDHPQVRWPCIVGLEWDSRIWIGFGNI